MSDLEARADWARERPAPERPDVDPDDVTDTTTLEDFGPPPF